MSTSSPFLSALTQEVGVSRTIDIDGVNIFDDGSTAFSTTGLGTTFQVGAQVGGSDRRWNGDIAELIVFDRALSASELNDVGFYLQKKWGINGAYLAIPEPSTMTLLGLGMIGLVARRRRAGRKAIALAALLTLVAANESAHAATLSSPTQISGNVLWLDGADVDGDGLAGGNFFPGGVATWVDKSGNGNNISQASGSLQPTNLTNTINGNQVVTFDGTGDYLSDSATYTARTVFAVYRSTTGVQQTSDLAQVWGNYDAGFHVAPDPRNAGGAFSFNGGGGSTAFWAVGGNDLSTTAVADTGNGEWSMDVPQLITAEFTADKSVTAHLISRLNGTLASHNFGGDIAEIIVFDRVLTDGSIQANMNELNDVRFYLQEKWNLGLGLSATVPEPSTFALLGLASLGLLFRRRKAASLLIALLIVGIATPVYATAVTTVGTYDPASSNDVSTNASGNPLGSTLTTDVAGFTTLVSNRFANDFGGVINFGSGATFTATSLEASYGTGATKTLNISTDALSVQTMGTLDVISDTRAAIRSGGNDISMTFDSITGGAEFEAVTQIGVTVLSRDSIASSTTTVTAFFSGGGSAFITDTITGPSSNDDTFFSFVAPGGESITGLDFQFVGGPGDDRLAIDDLAFITAQVFPVPEPSTALLLGLGLVGFAARRRRAAKLAAAALAVSMFALPADQAHADLITPALHYTFDSADASGAGAGSTIFDQGTSGTNGTVAGASFGFATGQFGEAGSFAGDSGYINSGAQFLSTSVASQSYTISFWMQNDGTIGNSGAIVSQYLTGNNNRFLLTVDEQFSAGGEVSWWHGAGGEENTSASNVSDNTWHHVAFVKDGTSSLTVYVDGVVDQSTGLGADTLPFAPSNMLIGSGNGSGLHPYTGLIDELQIFTTALTASEVGFLVTYNQTAVPVPEPTSFALLGLGLVGLVVRRRRSAGLNAVKSIVIAIAALLGFAASAQAAFIADDFSYTAGLLRDVGTGGTGFGGDWGDPGANTSTISVSAGDLSYTGGGYNITQTGTGVVGGNNGTGFRGSNRDLAAGLSGSVWFSALVRNNASTANSGIQFNNPSSPNNYDPDDWHIDLDGDTLDVRYNGTTTNDVVTGLTVGDTHLILGRWSVGAGNDTLEVWVDPAPIGMLPAADYTNSSADLGVSITSVGLFTYGTGGANFDALRLSNGASALFDVSGAIAIPEPSTALLLGVGLVGLVVRRRRKTAATLAVLLVCGLTASPASATLLAREDFETYAATTPVAGLSDGFGWTGDWATGGAGTRTVENASMSYTGGLFDIQGGNRAMQITYPNGTIDDNVASRPFASQTGTTYLSFLVQQSVENGDADFQQIGLDDNPSSNPNASVADNGGVFNARGNTSGDASTGVTSTTGETFFAVMRITKGGGNYNAVDVVINPTSIFEIQNTFTTDAGDTGISSVANFNIRRAFQEGGETYLIDNIRVGTTWADVITVAVPEPSTAFLLGLGLVGLIARRRRGVAKAAASCVAVALVFSLASSAQAVILPGAIGNDGLNGFDGSITVKARSTIGTGSRVAENAIDGTGMTLTGHVGSTANGENFNWMSNGSPTDNWYIIDLGQSYYLAEAQFFNFNTTVGSNTDRGIGTADIYVFDGASEPNANNNDNNNLTFDNAGWTLFSGSHAFTIAPGGDNYNTPDIIDFNNLSVRFLAFDINSTQGDLSFVGFSEIVFFEGYAVPEPSTALLLGVGLVGLVARRRRGVAKMTAACAAVAMVFSLASSAHAIMLDGAIGNDGFGGFDGSITSSARSEQTNGRVSEAAMNGAGLDPTGHQGDDDFGNFDNWLASGTTSWWKVDLGQTYLLKEALFYNFNATVAAGNTDRGVQTADIYIYDGATEPNASNFDISNSAFNNTGWTLFSAGHTFTQAPGGDNYNTPDLINFAGVAARFVAFDITSNYGDGGFVGIGEVQFFEAVVPEPSTALLLGLGLVGLSLRRNRSKRRWTVGRGWWTSHLKTEAAEGRDVAKQTETNRDAKQVAVRRSLVGIACLVALIAVFTHATQAEAGQSGYEAAVLNSNPTSYWRMEDGLGSGTMVNSVGAANHTTSGSPIFQEPSAGFGTQNAVRFNPADGADYGQATGVPITASFSVELWAKSATAAWNQLGWLASARGANGFIIHPNGGTSWSAYHVSSGGAFTAIGTHVAADITDWHHYAMTFDDATDTGIMYFDGAPVATNASVTNARAASSTITVTTGWDFNLAGRFGDGWVDELAIYSHALSPTEVSNHFSAFNSFVPEPSTAVLLGFGLIGFVSRRHRGVGCKTAVVLLLAASSAKQANAAPINWFAGPTVITSPSQIATDDKLSFLRAVNLGNNGAQLVSHPVLGTINFQDIGSVVDTYSSGSIYSDVGVYTGTSGDAGFDAVLDSFNYGGLSQTLTLNGLTVGGIYQIQVFASDDRGCCSTRTIQFDDGDTGAPTASVTQGSSPFFTGIFSADASTQIVQVFSNNTTVLNGYVLSQVVPEPNTAVLLGLALVGLATRRRRR
ncbi:MAG: PEP-CTERM sorting domain-containing protein [Planctomycetales bacterium]|nr:PEP-CTERM sorting domain-containing protein [Planctomycetales bacterium]